MKRLIGTLLFCGFLTASFAQSSKPVNHPKVNQKAAHRQIRKAQKQNAKAQKAANRKAKAKSKVKKVAA